MGSVMVATEWVAFAKTPTKDSASCPLEVAGIRVARDTYAARQALRNRSTYCAAAFAEERRSNSAKHISAAGKKSNFRGTEIRRKKLQRSCA
eukprot:871965-Pleurochrysis_carterae.AAC.1